MEAEGLVGELDRLKEKVEDLYDVPPEIDATWERLKKWMGTHVSRIPDVALQVLDLYPFLLQSVEKARQYAAHRQILLRAEGMNEVYV